MRPDPRKKREDGGAFFCGLVSLGSNSAGDRVLSGFRGRVKSQGRRSIKSPELSSHAQGSNELILEGKNSVPCREGMPTGSDIKFLKTQRRGIRIALRLTLPAVKGDSEEARRSSRL